MSTQSDPTLIRVYPARLSFPHLFKPRSFMGAADAEAYYSADLTGRGERFDGRVDAVDAFAGVEDDFGGSSSANDGWADDELLGNAA